jgi:hypothetical protein
MATSFTKLNKNMAAQTTAADGQLACNVTLQAVPLYYVIIFVNGIAISPVGDGTKIGVACYFSADGGVTPKLIGPPGGPTALAIGDLLYWNGSVAGYQLAAGSDTLDFDYLTSP